MEIYKTQILSLFGIEVGKIEYFYNQRQGGFSYGIQIKIDKVAGEEPKVIILVNLFEKLNGFPDEFTRALENVKNHLDNFSEKFNLYK